MGLSKPITLPKGRQNAFDVLYRERLLGEHETISGIGSMLTITRHLRAGLASLIECGFIKNILDVGCGDFNWMSAVDLRGVRYLGVDIVEKLIDKNRQRWMQPNIQFEQMDVVETIPPKYQFIICRDVFTHLPTGDIAQLFNNIKKSGAEYIAVTRYIPDEINRKIRERAQQLNTDASHGYWRTVDMQKAPFHFRDPLFSIMESQPGKTLDVWALADLPFIDLTRKEPNPASLADLEQYRFFQELKALPFVEKIELFGSRAEGTYRADSDIDLLLYCKEDATQKDWLNVCDIIDRADTTLPIDCVRFKEGW